MEQILLSSKEINRYEMVQARLKSGCKIEEILSNYHISRRAFYVNLHKFENEGIEGLKSKCENHRKTDKTIELKFEKLFKEHPYFSSYELSQIIKLNPRTIQRIVIRKNLSRVHKPRKERMKILDELKNKKNSCVGKQKKRISIEDKHKAREMRRGGCLKSFKFSELFLKNTAISSAFAFFD